MDSDKKRLQGKRWCFTINNPVEGYIALINWGTYGVCQLERGAECGTLHLQGFVIFATNQTLKAVKKLHEKAHWELMSGTLEQNEQYCQKEVNKDGSVAREPGTEPRCWGVRPAGRRHSHGFERHFTVDSCRVPNIDFSFLEDEVSCGYCPRIDSEISPWYQGIDPIAEFGL